MRGNILMTTLLLLAILSLSTLYMARESLWLSKTSFSARDSLQLDMLIDEALFKTTQLIQQLPIDIIPVNEQACNHTPCVLLRQEANVFLDQSLAQWLADTKISTPLSLSTSKMRALVIVEHLNSVLDAETSILAQYFRSTILLHTENKQSQFRMQATWKKTTLNGMLWAGSLTRLSWR